MDIPIESQFLNFLCRMGNRSLSTYNRGIQLAIDTNSTLINVRDHLTLHQSLLPFVLVSETDVSIVIPEA